jgi:diguanylate cyclase (GGDEF)-like protein
MAADMQDHASLLRAVSSRMPQTPSDDDTDLLDTGELLAEQRRRGHASLKFVPQLEREYRQNFARLNADRMKVFHGLGILVAVLFVPFDRLFGGHYQPLAADLLVGLMAVALTVPLLVAQTRWRDRALENVLVGGLMVTGLALVGVIAASRMTTPEFPYASLMLLSFYTYLMSSLPLRSAAICGGTALAAHIAVTFTLLPQLPTFWIYELYYLAGANIFGVFGRYITELHERAAYLLQRERAHDAAHDSLTGALNRKAFIERAEQIWAMAARTGSPLGLAVYDLDDFKQMNDRNGHQAGDMVLVRLVDTLSNNARRVLDAVGRFGGDEFAVLWCQSSESDFRRMQGTVRAQLQEVRWGDAPHQNGISVSAGALWVADATQISLRVALARADMLLYAAKRGGKNQVSFEAGDDLDSSSRI